MKTRNSALQAALILMRLSGNVSAVTDEQLGAIEEMGKWYGIALPCKYLQETRRIKQALVSALPRQRYMGQLFEQATNKSFLAFVEAGSACPGEANLDKNIDAGIDRTCSVTRSPILRRRQGERTPLKQMRWYLPGRVSPLKYGI